MPPERVAFAEATDTDHSLTYGQLKTRVLKCAASLKREFGIQRGDVVAICSPNNIEYAILFHGIIAAGGIVAAIRSTADCTPDDIVYNITTAKPKLVIIYQTEIDAVLPAAKEAGVSESNILLLTCDSSKTNALANIPTVESTLFSSEELAEPYPYTKDDLTNSPCCLYYTSGSTGRNKAVMIRQSSLIHYLLHGPLDVGALNSLIIAKFSYASGLFIYLTFGLFSRWTSYLLKSNELALEHVLEAIERLKINTTMMAPFMATELVKRLNLTKKYDMSSLSQVIVGGAYVDKSIIQSAKEELGLRFINTYGMTEILLVFRASVDQSIAGTVGRLVNGVLGRIVDDDGNDLPSGSEGELRIKGPTTTIGYYNQPEATTELFDDQGYLKTGDIFKADENGLLYYVTRKKDLIKYYGIHIFPAEIEEVIIGHPQVTDCAVIGVFSKEEGTEIPRAYVSLLDKVNDKESLLKEIAEYADSQLPDSKKLRGGIFEVSSFPRTGTGKIQRFKLQSMSGAE
ncbi:hypothetical protein RMATCC62417_17429 [Rhizopus microsporus]|nr:hypothetical protein RMATCC62417_17429 [Rhizopus microsporus]